LRPDKGANWQQAIEPMQVLQRMGKSQSIKSIDFPFNARQTGKECLWPGHFDATIFKYPKTVTPEIESHTSCDSRRLNMKQLSIEPTHRNTACGPGIRVRPAGVAVIAALLALGASGTAAARQDVNHIEIPLIGGYYCSTTSEAAQTACIYETRDDYLINWAVCINTIDREERAECLDEVEEERTEADEECAEQFEAREEVCELIGQGRYDPDYDPEDFEDPESIGYGPDDVAPNPWLPLVPGSKWVYEAEDEVIVVEVLEDTMEIDGVTCAVVRDVVYEVGEDDGDDEDSIVEDDDEMPGDPVEDTLDWFAQDKDGNIWYFGEISLNYEDGQIGDIEGSWKTGEEGARPGILVPALPLAGDVYRQEWLLGDAEDVAEVVSTAAEPELGEDNVGDCSAGCLQTLEWNPLESDSYEYKYYQAGVGMVQEMDLEDPESTVELVEYIVPGE